MKIIIKILIFLFYMLSIMSMIVKHNTLSICKVIPIKNNVINTSKYDFINKLCKDCRYFVPATNDTINPLDIRNHLGKCKNFYNININDIELNYEFAIKCRLDDNKCGESGKFFRFNNSY